MKQPKWLADWRDLLRFIFDLVLVGILILQWNTYRGQLHVMEKTNKRESGALKYAKRKDKPRILITEQPGIEKQPIKPNERVELNVTFQNTGEFSTANAWANYSVWIGTKQQNSPQEQYTVGTVGPKGSLPKIIEIGPFSEEQVAAINKDGTGMHLYFTGDLNCEDCNGATPFIWFSKADASGYITFSNRQ
jgi:hypothetical protein